MSEEHGQIELPPKKPRSDKGTTRKKGDAGKAVSVVMNAIEDLNREEIKRVLTCVGTFHAIRLIEAPVEGANGNGNR